LQIHEIVFHGKGGYSWNDVYNMPIWLRKFTYANIAEHYSKLDKQSKPLPEPKKKFGPDIKPSFSTKSTKNG